MECMSSKGTKHILPLNIICGELVVTIVVLTVHFSESSLVGKVWDYRTLWVVYKSPWLTSKSNISSYPTACSYFTEPIRWPWQPTLDYCSRPHQRQHKYLQRKRRNINNNIARPLSTSHPLRQQTGNETHTIGARDQTQTNYGQYTDFE